MLFLYHNYSSTILTMFTLRTEILTNLLSEVFYYYHLCPFYSNISMPYNKYKFFLLNWWVCFCFFILLWQYTNLVCNIFSQTCAFIYTKHMLSVVTHISPYLSILYCACLSIRLVGLCASPPGTTYIGCSLSAWESFEICFRASK